MSIKCLKLKKVLSTKAEHYQLWQSGKPEYSTYDTHVFHNSIEIIFGLKNVIAVVLSEFLGPKLTWKLVW